MRDTGELKAQAWEALKSVSEDPAALARGRELVGEILRQASDDAEGALLNGRFLTLEGVRSAKSLADRAAVFRNAEVSIAKLTRLK